MFGVKFYALFGNFHFKFTFHIIRVGRKAKPHIWHKINDLYLKIYVNSFNVVYSGCIIEKQQNSHNY